MSIQTLLANNIETISVFAGAVLTSSVLNLITGKKTKNKNDLSNKEAIKKYVLEFCTDCGFKERANKAVKTESQMAIALRLLSDLRRKLKTELLEYIADNNITEKEHVLDSPNYRLFEIVFEVAKEKIIDELRAQFHRNGFAEFSDYEKENRSSLLWDIVVKTFDEYYKTNTRPGRIELFELFDVKKDSYILSLSKIYNIDNKGN